MKLNIASVRLLSRLPRFRSVSTKSASDKFSELVQPPVHVVARGRAATSAAIGAIAVRVERIAVELLLLLLLRLQIQVAALPALIGKVAYAGLQLFKVVWLEELVRKK